jgi:hypothetical protein
MDSYQYVKSVVTMNVWATYLECLDRLERAMALGKGRRRECLRDRLQHGSGAGDPRDSLWMPVPSYWEQTR